jgi:two-component system, NarL family, sensor histidine kinase UhpB
LAVKIEKHKIIDECLVKARLFHEKILDSVADPLLVKDSDFRYVLMNDAFCNFVKLHRIDLLGLSDFDIFTPQEAHIFRAVDKTVLECGNEHENEEKITDPDGIVHYFAAKKTRYIDEKGNRFIVCILRDITAHKRAEENLNEKRKSLTAMAIELSLAEERERIRIASELHDQIGQSLILARIKMAQLKNLQHSEEFESVSTVVSDLLDKVIQNVRSMTVQISPPLLVAAGLEASLEFLSRQMLTDYDLKVEFYDDRSEKPLSEELRFVLYQIARELLINVAKHANADMAWLSICRKNERLLLCVEDRGKGFNSDDSLLNGPSSCSFGLFNIQQRVEHLGGMMSVWSKVGHGAAIEVEMPLTIL